MIEVRRLPASEVGVIAAIDRSEHVDVQYEVRDGRIVERPVLMADIPGWNPVGDGEHSLAHGGVLADPVHPMLFGRSPTTSSSSRP